VLPLSSGSAERDVRECCIGAGVKAFVGEARIAAVDERKIDFFILYDVKLI
jgi:hypothetical protein